MRVALKDEQRAQRTVGKKTAVTISRSGANDAAMFRRMITARPIIGSRAIKQIRDGLNAEVIRSASSFFGAPRPECHRHRWRRLIWRITSEEFALDKVNPTHAAYGQVKLH